jgi:hypothetical protein
MADVQAVQSIGDGQYALPSCTVVADQYDPSIGGGANTRQPRLESYNPCVIGSAIKMYPAHRRHCGERFDALFWLI